MKQFQNKETEVSYTDDKNVTRKAFYADLLNIAMMQVSPANTIAQQRKDFRILDKLEDAIKDKTETLEFEDSDFTYLLEQVKKTIWNFKHRALIDLEDDLNAAQ